MKEPYPADAFCCITVVVLTRGRGGHCSIFFSTDMCVPQGLVVEALVDGSPAARCGQILAGDVLERVSDTPVLDMAISQVAPVILAPLRLPHPTVPYPNLLCSTCPTSPYITAPYFSLPTQVALDSRTATLPLLYFTSPYLTIPSLTLPYLTLPYLTLPCLALPYLALPYLTLPYLTLPYLTLPYHTLPYPGGALDSRAAALLRHLGLSARLDPLQRYTETGGGWRPDAGSPD